MTLPVPDRGDAALPSERSLPRTLAPMRYLSPPLGRCRSSTQEVASP